MILTISIPLDSTCLLKNGDIVDFNTPFLYKKINSEITVSVSAKIGVKPGKIFTYLKKFVGETVNKGDILALKKDVFSEKKLISEYQGIIKEIDHHQGIIIILVSQNGQKKINSFFKGEISEISKNEIKLKVKDCVSLDLINTSHDFCGEIVYFKDHYQPLFAPEVNNKIIAVESVSSYFLTKADALGIRGLVILTKSTESINLPNAQLKRMEDLKKMYRSKFPYCLVDKKYSKIYLYSV